MKAEDRGQKAEVALAELLAYPGEDLSSRVADALDALVENPEARDEITAFYDEVENVAVCGLEELYTQTFDLNPVASLDLGWHLYGEQYERGRFLADLREHQANAGVDAGIELPDHLTAVLRLVGETDDANLAALSRTAIEKIAKPLNEHGNPYRHLIKAADLLFEARCAPLAGVKTC